MILSKKVLIFLMLIQFILISSFSLPHYSIDKNVKEEEKRVNNIDFYFSLNKNEIGIKGAFEIKSTVDCAKHITFDFDHKKAYTLGVTALELGEKGYNWYEANFIIEKYFFAKVRALYHYSLDDDSNKVDFYLKKNYVNLSNFDVVNSSVGSIKFEQEGDNVKISYDLLYKLKPTMFRKSLYRIQKKESIEFLTTYKAYMEKFCS